MYDLATLPAEQLGEKVLPEPFSKKQHVQSRLDGGEEIDGTRRTLVEVTAPEPQGHVVRERTLAEAELRACRFFVTERCRSPDASSRRYLITGCRKRLARSKCPMSKVCGTLLAGRLFRTPSLGSRMRKGEISAFRLPKGSEASAEEVEQDARNWARAFA